MKLWTYHRRPFEVDTVTEIDHTKSDWWTYDSPKFRYREVLPKLWERIGTKHFLWCGTEEWKRWWVVDEDKWELDVPDSSIICFYRELVWDEIVWTKGDDEHNWSKLIVDPEVYGTEDRIGVLVPVPLPPNSAMKCPCIVRKKMW